MNTGKRYIIRHRDGTHLIHAEERSDEWPHRKVAENSRMPFGAMRYAWVMDRALARKNLRILKSEDPEVFKRVSMEYAESMRYPAHDLGCEGDCGGIFLCTSCQRMVGWCVGHAHDENGPMAAANDWCADCWCKVHDVAKLISKSTTIPQEFRGESGIDNCFAAVVVASAAETDAFEVMKRWTPLGLVRIAALPHEQIRSEFRRSTMPAKPAKEKGHHGR